MISRSWLEEEAHELGPQDVLWQLGELPDVLVEVSSPLRSDVVVDVVQGAGHEGQYSLGCLAVLIDVATCFCGKVVEEGDLELVEVFVEACEREEG